MDLDGLSSALSSVGGMKRGLPKTRCRTRWVQVRMNVLMICSWSYETFDYQHCGYRSVARTAVNYAIYKR